MVDSDDAEEQDSPERMLIRPYIQNSAGDTGYRLPEGGSPPAPTAELPLLEEPAAVPAPAPAPAPEPAADGSQDRRQMAWLAGAGLALVVAIGVTIVALWPGSDENPSVAAPPGGFTWPARAGSAPPTPSAAGPSTSVPGSPSPSTSSSPAPSASASVLPSTPPPSPPPSATLAPPPAADRVGPITGPGGDCLDVAAGIVLPAGAVVARDCNGTLSQRWTAATDGTLRVSGLCAAADGAGQAAVGVCGDAASGQWRSGPGGTLVNVGTGQCLTGPADGNRVRLTACGADAQTWALP